MPAFVGTVRRLLSTAQDETDFTNVRFGRYGELIEHPLTVGAYANSMQGNYFKASNPTPNTGILASVQTTFSATNGLLLLEAASAGADRQVVVDYIRLIVVGPGTGTTRVDALVAIDNIPRFSSGGSLITNVNSNMDSGTGYSSRLRFGALTLVAEGASVRRLSRFVLRDAIYQARQEFIITFGRDSLSYQSQTLVTATADRYLVDAGPIIIGTGDSFVLHVWKPAQATAEDFEFEIGWWEL